MGKEFDDIRLPQGVEPLPVMKRAGYFTFNQSGKDDYNFKWSPEELYSPNSKQNFWRNRKPGQPFFGQIQLRGGKLGGRAPKKSTPPKCPCLLLPGHSTRASGDRTSLRCLLDDEQIPSPSWRKTALPSPRSFSASAITATNFIVTSSSCTKAAFACR